MRMVCLDVEGVLFSEIWQAIAKATGIEALARTTREEPCYAKLMAGRLDALNQGNITYDALIRVASSINPLPGAKSFLDKLRADYQVALISDSFYEFLQPLSVQLGNPSIYCHRLVQAADGRLANWQPRLLDQKPKCVRAFQELGFEVFAAGDSHNDLGMLAVADHAALIHAPTQIQTSNPEYTNCQDYETLERRIRAAPWKTKAIR